MTPNHSSDLANILDDRDDELTPDAMTAAAAIANSGPDGWDACGMDVYDGPEYGSPADGTVGTED